MITSSNFVGCSTGMSEVLAAGHAWPFASLQQETIMGTRTVSLLLAICAAGVWAPAHAQNADTSVVKLPQDIVYKGLSGAPQHVLIIAPFG